MVNILILKIYIISKYRNTSYHLTIYKYLNFSKVKETLEK